MTTCSCGHPKPKSFDDGAETFSIGPDETVWFQAGEDGKLHIRKAPKKIP